MIDDIEHVLEYSKSRPSGQVFRKCGRIWNRTLLTPDQIMYFQRASMLTERANTIYYQRLTARMLDEEPVKTELDILSKGMHQ